MVLLEVKKAEDAKFLYEAPASESLDVVVREVCDIHNTRLRVRRLAEACAELALYGVSRVPEHQGLEDEALMLETGVPIPAYAEPMGGCVKRKDPSARRCGVAPSDELAAVLARTVEEARALTSPKQVERREKLTKQALVEMTSRLQGAVMIVYPMGLAPYDLVQQILDGTEDLSMTGDAKEVIELDQATLWWAGKELRRDKTLADFVGKNEKTKIVARLAKRGGGPPARENPLDADGQRNMLAFYHKRQEELKKLETDESEAHASADWANPHQLKQQFLGLGSGVRFR